ncbi:MAG: hypothetical protein KC729_16740, partial [Candidatus Eisenbacteria bacterium]|nr:hypothetical protein [Candidatus Eisenbacteria bacterium]
MSDRPTGLHQRPPLELRLRWSESESRHQDPIRQIVRLALAEDVGPGDATTLSVVPNTVSAIGRIIAKQSGIVSGLVAVRATIDEVDPSVSLDVHRQDGDAVMPGTEVATLRGPARSLLTLERVALNFLQRLSGVATLTSR